MDKQVWRARLMRGQWFSHLPVSLQDSLLGAARVRHLSAGQRLFQRGDPPCGLYAVLEGAVRVGAVNEQGKEALLGLVESPNWFGEICLFDGQPRTHDAFGVGQSTLLHLPQTVLLKMLDEQPGHWRQLALLMSQKLRMTFINLEQLSLLPAPARLAHRLLMIAEGYGQLDEPRRVLQLPQEQLAAMLSLSRQTTNQILKDLQGQGILRLGYGEIEILDVQRLRALVVV
ncbi:Crp/Fnr family transcriptional regulator [Pseudomonas umsongensis]|jgi:CRP-like cAMP-binding protein|uniref:Crp/Fnr family transcriptional regulator n=1 Tax=Pseudomonas umsongensis TaxID=198618 RepID=A0AAE6ZRS0_9PSED|nr:MULTISPECIES: Crp/Fnr family transcriptional regulator [Pseudomonas]KEX89606.1 Crp/Fnr family transcriptional regulator [Pseudomonas putida]EPA98742.1 cAMP-binding protein [Pseudomonas sp. G5(2012)]MBT9574017.1 Crp/Fnr family transcriptional regulator [Pseudomonas umsongensis]OXR30773.1 Crp/Fnr family transcriptional regulator [Pseudomonas umsongensis]QFG33394.1 Crp/Fnr family transcriptional regulator [Pseudomonas umsongensis]